MAINKRSQVALAFAAGYLLLKVGIAIYRHPVGAVVIFAILTVFSVIGGASASDVVHAIFSFAVILGLVFIIGLACEGRLVAAFLWFIALLIGVAILRGMIGYVVAIVASGYLTDYHWWFARRHAWLPSPALIAFYLLLVAVAIIKESFSPPQPDDQKRETACGTDKRSTEEQEHTAPRAKREAWIVPSRTPIRPFGGPMTPRKHIQASQDAAAMNARRGGSAARASKNRQTGNRGAGGEAGAKRECRRRRRMGWA